MQKYLSARLKYARYTYSSKQNIVKVFNHFFPFFLERKESFHLRRLIAKKYRRNDCRSYTRDFTFFPRLDGVREEWRPAKFYIFPAVDSWTAICSSLRCSRGWEGREGG